MIPSMVAVLLGLLGICTGFFTIHVSAVCSLNSKLSGGHGKANALYVLFYYMGGWLGITGSGLAYKQWDWDALIYICLSLLIIPLGVGIRETISNNR